MNFRFNHDVAVSIFAFTFRSIILVVYFSKVSSNNKEYFLIIFRFIKDCENVFNDVLISFVNYILLSFLFENLLNL